MCMHLFVCDGGLCRQYYAIADSLSSRNPDLTACCSSRTPVDGKVIDWREAVTHMTEILIDQVLCEYWVSFI